MKALRINHDWIRGQKTEDPLRHIFSKRLIIYMAVLTICLLWPFDFFQKNKVRWLPNSEGIEFSGNGVLLTQSPPELLYKKIQEGQGLSLELWLATASPAQIGPARIISYSFNPGLRNFSLGQQGEQLDVRLRTVETNLNGTRPALRIDHVFNSTERLHIVVTYDGEKETVYIDGKVRMEAPIPGGNFSNWDPTHYLFLGNEGTVNRPWLGKLFKVSIYNRQLGSAEILNKYRCLLEKGGKPGCYDGDYSKGLVADYHFAEGKDRVVGNAIGMDGGVNLYMPKHLRVFVSPFMRWPEEGLSTSFKHSDTVLNIFGFIPFGFLLHGMLRNRFGLSWPVSALVLSIGSFTSLFFEAVQFWSISRDSSSLDLFNNTIGAMIGITLDRVYIRHIRSYWHMRNR